VNNVELIGMMKLISFKKSLNKVVNMQLIAHYKKRQVEIPASLNKGKRKSLY